jgi:hypothetical protein
MVLEVVLVDSLGLQMGEDKRHSERIPRLNTLHPKIQSP